MMDDEIRAQIQAVLWMMEALRMEIRTIALIQQRTPGAAEAIGGVRQKADDCAKAAGAFNGG